MDETDLALVHALQLQPRVTWARLARILDVDASTLTRRWARLSRQGLAWFSCYPSNTKDWTGHAWEAGALVEVECLPGWRQAVMDHLMRRAAVWNIDATSGRRDLMLTMRAPSIADLDNDVVTSIATIDGIRATRTHFFRSVIREGSSWRLNALSPQQQRELTPASAREGRARPNTRDLELLKILGPDARLPASAVAEQLGCSVSTASRWLERLVDSKFTSIRCDVAHYIAGWRVAATLWLDVPQQDLRTVAAAIARLPQIRLCATIGSEANLVAQVWLHRLEDLDQFETLLATQFSGTRVLDRWITPRFAKRLGHIIGHDGRQTGFVSFFATP
ncbi:Lrp/AsnC family transcriptional regulator [Haloactinomyces albus]|uniref:DNA-binding Lrp family transcriptional regulator n=1 Tax=Haloactinomyces albus TaxID=1352928 RepID=A0AAE3Z9N4_9ACTN|nr:Lrp/AsnC family transcriptional regulator [Haloactinomyces albus]MDR7299840.1 DNA-binding Lrp family transcriptional regulator [Haloactinomyces albus]